MHRKLQGMIQIFIRIVFRSIGRQEKHFDFLLVFFQPCGNKLAMMDLQVIQNQEYLLLGGTGQPLHKLNQSLLVHGILIDHKADLTLTADRRDHIDPLPLRLHRQHRRTALRGKAALYDFTIAYSGFVCPIDPCLLCLCTPCNRMILLFFPPLDAGRILFPRTLRGALAAHAPALHVIRQGPLIHCFPPSLLDIFPCPS